MAILEFKDGSDIVGAIVDAVTRGYREDLILNELAEAIESQKIDQQTFESSVDALRLFANRLSASINILADSMEQFEFHQPQDSILKNKPLTLAQQAMQDVNGFRDALKSHGEEQDEPGQPQMGRLDMNPSSDDTDWVESGSEDNAQ